ncbi:hypothetical protein Nepgr_021340 [Nepenthes gracilis]|uniref:Uncharacterized protein n=1 Tax=Nepenthes gracilis TaxID=150966 RepID=A0AAD3XWY2_NEPGR|nr:hypothetical protein Nepgr_021340 [Nepenthes gracilis]
MDTENESLKVENARLKEENERVNGHLDQLTWQMAALENDLSLRIRPHKVADMMLSWLWEGINVSRCFVRLVDPDFPVDLINLSNRSAQRCESLMGEPRDR